MSDVCERCGAATDAFLCFGCGEELAYALAELPSLISAVIDRERRATRVYRQTRWHLPEDEELAGLEEEHGWRMALIPARLRDRDGRVTLPSTALMTDLDAAALVDEARNRIGTWVRHIAEPRGAALPDHDGACAWLMLNLDSIRYDEAAAVIANDLIALRVKLARAVDSSPAWVFAGPCDDCGVDLYRPHGADKIVCDGRVTREPGCGRQYTVAERTDWLLDSVAEALVPLAELKAFLVALHWPWPPTTTVGSWRLRGRLKVRGLNMHGAELFRGGDVIELLVEWEERDRERRTRAC